MQSGFDYPVCRIGSCVESEARTCTMASYGGDDDTPLLARARDACSNPSPLAGCCACLTFTRSDQVAASLRFSNTHWQPSGDKGIKDVIVLGVFFPLDAETKPRWLRLDRSKPVTKVLEAACAACGYQLDRGRLVGSPDRINLFTLDGDMLRTDLELEAHIPSTLQELSMIILEKGNRLQFERLRDVQEAARLQRPGGGSRAGGMCTIM